MIRWILLLLWPVAGLAAQPSPHTLAEAGYGATRQGDDQAAIIAFTAAYELAPGLALLPGDIAYAHKRLGENDAAGEWFAEAVARLPDADLTQSEHDERALALLREWRQMRNSWHISAWALRREDAGSPLDPTGTSAIGSQAGLQAEWRLPWIGFHDGRSLAVYGRLLAGLQFDRWHKDSLQAGLGLRFKPLKRHNLVLSAERLLAIGDQARDDWMLRLGWSFDRGTQWRTRPNGWWVIQAGLDAALIDPGAPDLYVTAGGEVGPAWSPRPNVFLVTHAVVNGVWRDEAGAQRWLVEAGGGVKLIYAWAETGWQRRAPRIELKLQWRSRMAGSFAQPSGPALTLLLRY